MPGSPLSENIPQDLLKQAVELWLDGGVHSKIAEVVNRKPHRLRDWEKTVAWDQRKPLSVVSVKNVNLRIGI